MTDSTTTQFSDQDFPTIDLLTPTADPTTAATTATTTETTTMIIPNSPLQPPSPTQPPTAVVVDPPSKKKKKTKNKRATLKLPMFSIQESTQLTNLIKHFETSREVEKTEEEEAEQKSDPTKRRNSPLDYVKCFSKYLRFQQQEGEGEGAVTNADQLNFLQQVNDHLKLGEFLKHLRGKGGFSHSRNCNYIHAISLVADYLLLDQSLSTVQRDVLGASKQHFMILKKARAREGKKDARKNQSREKLIERGEWLEKDDWSNTRIKADIDADQLIIKFNDNSTNSRQIPNQDECIFYRSYVIFYLFLYKACRPMIYKLLDVTKWNNLQRDKENRKIYSSDQFKTEKTYSMDTIIFPLELEQKIDNYIHIFRPVLNKITPVRSECSDAVFLTSNGNRLSHIDTDLSRIFKKYCGKNINPTSVRKYIATYAKETLSVEEQQKIAKNDTHSDSTVAQYYYKEDSYQTAFDALILQQKLLFGADAGTTGADSTVSHDKPPVLEKIDDQSLSPSPSDQSSSMSTTTTTTTTNTNNTTITIANATTIPIMISTTAPSSNPIPATIIATQAKIEPSSSLQPPPPKKRRATPSSSSSKRKHTWTKLSDQIILEFGDRTTSKNWTDLLSNHPTTFASIEKGEQLRWRYKNLIKKRSATIVTDHSPPPSPSPSPPPKKKAKKTHQRPPSQPSSSSSTQPPTTITSILSSKTIDATLWVKVAYTGGSPPPLWVLATSVQNTTAFQSFVERQ